MQEKRIEYEMSKLNVEARNIIFPIERFRFLVDETGSDFCSLDTEGDKLEILKSIGFSEYNCNALTIGDNFNENDIDLYLDKFSYFKTFRFGCDDIFLLKSEFKFVVKFRLSPWRSKRTIKFPENGLIKRLGLKL